LLPQPVTGSWDSHGANPGSFGNSASEIAGPRWIVDAEAGAAVVAMSEKGPRWIVNAEDGTAGVAMSAKGPRWIVNAEAGTAGAAMSAKAT
jgi:hypothetical protein